MSPNQVDDAAAEFNSRVQIVSPPPDQFHLTDTQKALAFDSQLDGIGLGDIDPARELI